MKRVIRLTESDLHNIVSKSVKNILREYTIMDVNGNPFSAHGNDPIAWDKLEGLRAKKWVDAMGKYLDAEDPVMKRLYDYDAELHGTEAMRNKRNAEELRNKPINFSDEYDDEYLMQFIKRDNEEAIDNALEQDRMDEE